MVAELASQNKCVFCSGLVLWTAQLATMHNGLKSILNLHADFPFMVYKNAAAGSIISLTSCEKPGWVFVCCYFKLTKNAADVEILTTQITKS